MKRAFSFNPAKRLTGFEKPTVWHEFTPLALQYNAINLGQGFPDWECDAFVKQAAQSAIDLNFNQYARPQGHKNLVQQLARKYTERWNRPIDGLNQICVSVGATEGIYSALCSLINPGDQVVILEPSFDIYKAQVQMAGGECRFVPLDIDRERGVALDLDLFRAAFNDSTRAFIFNSPHNPTGHVFSAQEMQQIARVIQDFPNVVVIADEVYEHIVFDQQEHRSLAEFSDLQNRTLTISSAGKTFSVTGWKVGWAVGPEHLIQGMCLANNWIQFSVATPLQQAVSTILERSIQPYENEPSYYHHLSKKYESKRDRLVEALRTLGLDLIVPKGGIFVYCNIASLAHRVPSDSTETLDWRVCRWLTQTVGVAAIPATAFYCPENKHLGQEWIRLAFCKTDQAIEEAIKRLTNGL